MKHIRNFRNFSINELQDWVMMPVDVNRGLGDMLNKFYSKFPTLISEVKDFLGNKFSEFSDSLIEISSEIKKLSSEKLAIISNDLKKFAGNGNMRTKIEEVLKQELNKSGIIKENKNAYNQAIKNTMTSISPLLAETQNKLLTISIYVLLPATILFSISAAAISGIAAIIMAILTGIFVIAGLTVPFFFKD